MSGSDNEDLEISQARVGTTVREIWKLDSLLGVGGMAAVYSATHKLGHKAAIKILHPQIAVSKELRARFEQEAQAISKLGHPGTVQVFDVDATEDGAPFMVMELLNGESLGQRAYRLGNIAEDDLLRYVDGVLDVMIAAHAAGIVHRDIKPDNLFVTREGQVKVLDFGIARMRESGGGGVRTRTGAMLGTTPYMAPEQIHAKPVDGRVDLFAIGATMFRILTKRRIHEAETDAELLMKMGSTPAPSILLVQPTISPRLAKVVDRALVFDRDRRYPDAVTMQADVRAVLRGEDPPHASAAALVSEERTAPERQLGSRGASPSAGAATDRAFAKTAPGVARNPVNTGLVVLLGFMMLAVGAAGAFYFWGPPSQSSQRNAAEAESAETQEDEREAASSSKPALASQTPSAVESAPQAVSAEPSAAPSVSASAAKSTAATPLPRPTGSKPSSTGLVKPKKPALKTPGRN